MQIDERFSWFSSVVPGQTACDSLFEIKVNINLNMYFLSNTNFQNNMSWLKNTPRGRCSIGVRPGECGQAVL